MYYHLCSRITTCPGYPLFGGSTIRGSSCCNILPPSPPSPLSHCLGLAFHYFILQLVLLWFFHTVAVFQGTLFPFYTKRLKSNKKLKYVHMVMFVLGVFLPAVLVGIIAGVGEGFTLTRTPTIFCTAYQKHINYGCMILPISIVIAIGSTLLVFILWTVIKVRTGYGLLH